jgi:hypothetical protein
MIVGSLFILFVGLVAGSLGGYYAGRESAQKEVAARMELPEPRPEAAPAATPERAKPPAPASPPGPAASVSRDEFRAKVMGKGLDDVNKAMGKPDDVRDSDGPNGLPGSMVWYYSKRTFDPANAKTDATATVTFRNGVAVEIGFE